MPLIDDAKPDKSKKSKAKTKKAKTKSKAKAVKKEAVYSTVKMKLCSGDSPMTVAMCKRLLGWRKLKKDENVAAEQAVFVDLVGDRIAFDNNSTNRPIYKGVLNVLKQEHLRGRWRLNGEPIIIGKYGAVLNGQHTMISLILASQEFKADADRWIEYWQAEPTMDKLIVFGIAEDDDVVNTLDTGKQRTLTDVVYRSALFGGLAPSERRQAAKMTDVAVRFLWLRTGEATRTDRRTHSESVDFIMRHPRILDCVKFITEENSEKEVTKYIQPGFAAGLLYLMGCSATEPADYTADTHPSEESLDWKMYDRACEFWVLFADGGKEFSAIRKAIARLPEVGNNTNTEKFATIAKAWAVYADNRKPTGKDVALRYNENADGFRQFIESPTVGGIDVGAEPAEIVEPEPDPDEIEQRAKTEKENGNGKKLDKPPKSKGKGKTSFDVEDDVWIFDPGGGHWAGKITELYDKTARVQVTTGFAGAGTEYETPLDSLRADQPTE